MSKKIIVTGASGFIGQHLVRHYANQGDTVYAVIRTPEKLDASLRNNENVKICCADFDSFDNLSELIEDRDFDIFYYLAWGGYGKATNDYREQVKNIKPVCDAIVEAKKMGVNRYLFASSLSEYMIKEGSKTSHEKGACCNLYGSAKTAARVMAQAVAAQQKMPYISVGFANTFGPGDTSHRSTNLFIHQLLNGQDINLTEGVQMYDWNYIDDALNGLVLAGEHGQTDTYYYIGNKERRPLKEIVAELRDIIAPDAKINLGKYHDEFYMDYSCLDVDRLYRDTGYRPSTQFKEAIVATVNWVKTLEWN